VTLGWSVLCHGVLPALKSSADRMKQDVEALRTGRPSKRQPENTHGQQGGWCCPERSCVSVIYGTWECPARHNELGRTPLKILIATASAPRVNTTQIRS
jgi:hypothetical protein